MKEAVCYVVGAGDFLEEKLVPKKEDYVIGVDGGYEYLKKLQIEADLVVGDFDSLSYSINHPHVIKLPSEKDDTDMLFALKKGWELGYKKFHIYGGLGGRVSHTIANLQCLVWLAEKGCEGFLFYKNILITAVQNGSISFEPERQGYISVFAFGKEAKGVNLKNLKYPLEDATLTINYPLGTSNAFVGRRSEISVEDGILLVVVEEEQN